MSKLLSIFVICLKVRIHMSSFAIWISTIKFGYVILQFITSVKIQFYIQHIFKGCSVFATRRLQNINNEMTYFSAIWNSIQCLLDKTTKIFLNKQFTNCCVSLIWQRRNSLFENSMMSRCVAISICKLSNYCVPINVYSIHIIKKLGQCNVGYTKLNIN